MSVLVESPSLIVRRAALDVRYPGGMNGFLRDMELPEHRVLRTCVDSHLTCVSFLLVMHARRVADKLATLGLKHIVDVESVELAIVGNGSVPDAPCPWMEIARHRDGYTHAWLGASEPGELSAPQGWDFERALRTEIDEFADECRDCARISVDDGLETWLDYRTGEMETRAATVRSASVPACESPAQDVPLQPLFPVVLAALAATKTHFARGDDPLVAFSWHSPSGIYWYRTSVNEEERDIVCFCTFGTHVPEAQRSAVYELLLRLNESASDCSFMIDPETGWVSAVMFRRIQHPVCSLYDIYMIWNRVGEFAGANCESIMRVAFGGMSPYEYAPYTPTSE